MTEKERDKVLHGLNSCGFVDGIPNVCGITECPYRVNKPWCTHELTHDAGVLIHELLTAQEPRVMTLEEVAALGDEDAVYIECLYPDKTVIKPAIYQPDASSPEEDGYYHIVSSWSQSGFYHKDSYGQTWRCWTSRPTDEQREATLWGDQ